MSRHLEKSKAFLREVKHASARRVPNHNRANNNEQYRTHGRDGKDGETTMIMKMKNPVKKTDCGSEMWIPHPRTGIYYPQGHEWVMEDIPNGDTSFKQTYWLRNSEGADQSSSDYANSATFDHPFL